MEWNLFLVMFLILVFFVLLMCFAVLAKVRRRGEIDGDAGSGWNFTDAGSSDAGGCSGGDGGGCGGGE